MVTLIMFGCQNAEIQNKYKCIDFQSRSITDKVESHLVSESMLTEDSIPIIMESFNITSEIDTLVQYTMNEEHQLRFEVGKVEFENFISKGDSMMLCLFKDDVPRGKLKKIYEKTINIMSIGEKQVIEYLIEDGPEAFPHSILIVYSTEGKSCVGNMIISDGIKWIYDSKTNSSILVFVERIRIHRQLGIPLFHTGNFFVPVAHYKLDDKWD